MTMLNLRLYLLMAGVFAWAGLMWICSALERAFGTPERISFDLMFGLTFVFMGLWTMVMLYPKERLR